MNNICYTLAVRQRRCQNGISRSTDNVYTNISNGTEIALNFGYTLTYISSSSSHATIQISNSSQIPSLIFNIPNNSFKIFDLPVQSGNLRVYIGATGICCSETIVCSSI